MVKSYILAPNWTTAPPPDGPLKLGHILDDLTEFVPINRLSMVEIRPEYLNKIDVKDGFQSCRSTLVSGELGLVAKVIGIFGVGAGAGIYYKKDNNDILSCDTLETMTFDPTAEYITRTMSLPEVAQYMKACRFKRPVYMITGFKIGRGGSLQSNSSRNRSVKLDGGLIAPGNPVGIEGNVGFIQEQSQTESWEGSTDFIVAFRARKIWYERGTVKSMNNCKGVVMQDGVTATLEPESELHMSDELAEEDVELNMKLTTCQAVECGETISWIIPDTA